MSAQELDTAANSSQTETKDAPSTEVGTKTFHKNNLQSYKEIGRVKLTDKVSAVLSEAYREGKLNGYYLNKFVSSDSYTGYTKGFFIPESMLPGFLSIFPKIDLEFALDSKEEE